MQCVGGRSWLGAALLACACGAPPAARTTAPTPAPADSAASADAPGDTPASAPAAKEDSLFDERKTGWSQVGAEERAAMAALATDYLAFVDQGRSERRAAQWLLDAAKSAGAIELDALQPSHPAQTLAQWSDADARTLILAKVGKRPVSEGLRVIIVSLDAGLLRLTARPRYESHGLVMFDTQILGSRSLERWLHTPLALDLYSPAVKGGAAIDTIIGDEADEPVFSIPDLLPHLSRKVQRKKLIDSPERLDIVGGRSAAAVAKAMKSVGLSDQRFATTEAIAVPAAAPSFVGIDKALIAGPNQEGRALAFAATRALLESDAEHTTVLLFQGNDEHDPAAPNAMQRIQQLLPRVISARAPKTDALSLRRIQARTAVLIGDESGGKRNRGIAINNRHDDASPAAFRKLLTLLDESEVHYQLVESSGWSQARRVANLNMDTMELSLPIEGKGAPFELLSIYDLYQGLAALKAWVQR